MKILFISHLMPWPLRTGAALRNNGEILELARDNTVDMITFYQKVLHPKEGELEQAIAETRKMCRRLEVFPIPTDASKLAWYALLLLNIPFLKPYSTWRFYSPRVAQLIKKLCREEKYDVVHIDTIALAPYLACITGCPIVLNHHNIESEMLYRRAAAEKNILCRMYVRLQAYKLRCYEKKMAKKFDLNVCVSEVDEKLLAQLVPGVKTIEIPNGTNTSYFKPEHVGHTQGLVFVGGMTWYPNREGMIWFCQEVYPLIKEKLPEVTLKVIGSSPAPEIIEMSREDPSIEVLGVVDDIRKYLAEARVYVVPLRVGGGTRLKILDAMASGKAIVSTTIGAEGLEVTHGKDILIADTAQDFSAQVVRLYTDQELRQKVEENARDTVDAVYSWRVIGPKQVKAYRELARARAPKASS